MELPSERISFIIGICAHNERHGTELLLRRLQAEQFVHSLDSIVVVSTASTDGTDETVRAFENDKIHLVREEVRKGKYTAINQILEWGRNRGVAVIVLISADVVPLRGAVDSLVSKFEDQTVGCVSGRPVVWNRTGVMGMIGRALWETHHETFSFHASRESITHATGELMACRTEAVETLPKIMIDDVYLANVVLNNGFSVLYEPQAEVMIWAPTRLTDLWKQRKRNLQGLRELREHGTNLQTLTYSGIPMIALIILRVVRRNPSLIPAMPTVLLIELLGRVYAHFIRPQKVAWDMILTAKPITLTR